MGRSAHFNGRGRVHSVVARGSGRGGHGDGLVGGRHGGWVRSAVLETLSAVKKRRRSLSGFRLSGESLGRSQPACCASQGVPYGAERRSHPVDSWVTALQLLADDDVTGTDLLPEPPRRNHD